MCIYLYACMICIAKGWMEWAVILSQTNSKMTIRFIAEKCLPATHISDFFLFHILFLSRILDWKTRKTFRIYKFSQKWIFQSNWFSFVLADAPISCWWHPYTFTSRALELFVLFYIIIIIITITIQNPDPASFDLYIFSILRDSVIHMAIWWMLRYGLAHSIRSSFSCFLLSCLSREMRIFGDFTASDVWWFHYNDEKNSQLQSIRLKCAKTLALC